MLRPRQTGEAVHSDDEWSSAAMGSIFPIAWVVGTSVSGPPTS
jgi:hypothetical protein